MALLMLEASLGCEFWVHYPLQTDICNLTISWPLLHAGFCLLVVFDHLDMRLFFVGGPSLTWRDIMKVGLIMISICLIVSSQNSRSGHCKIWYINLNLELLTGEICELIASLYESVPIIYNWFFFSLFYEYWRTYPLLLWNN